MSGCGGRRTSGNAALGAGREASRAENDKIPGGDETLSLLIVSYGTPLPRALLFFCLGRDMCLCVCVHVCACEKGTREKSSDPRLLAVTSSSMPGPHGPVALGAPTKSSAPW